MLGTLSFTLFYRLLHSYPLIFDGKNIDCWVTKPTFQQTWSEVNYSVPKDHSRSAFLYETL